MNIKRATVLQTAFFQDNLIANATYETLMYENYEN